MRLKNSVLLAFVKIRFQIKIVHKQAYIGRIISQAASYGASFFMVFILVDRFKNINGWDPYEVLFLYAVNLCSYALAGVFFFCPTQWLSKHIRTGDFNDIFIRPVNSLWYFVCKYINLDYISHISLSVTTMIICIIKLDIKITFVKICFLILTLISAAIIQGSAMMIFSIPQIKWISGNVSRIFFYLIKRITEYPLSIYSGVIQFILTFVFPYAFISFYPSQFFLGKSDFLFFSPLIQFASPAVAALLFIIMKAFWKKGINWYQGTGT